MSFEPENITSPNPPEWGFSGAKGLSSRVRQERVNLGHRSAHGFLVRCFASGVCHSEQALRDIEDRPHFNDNYTLGHEGCGEIVRIGEQVTDPRFQIVRPPFLTMWLSRRLGVAVHSQSSSPAAAKRPARNAPGI
ncbi:hypothetical protein VTO42DRAFT_313 [Malbranchea cinnamomea]